MSTLPRYLLTHSLSFVSLLQAQVNHKPQHNMIENHETEFEVNLYSANKNQITLLSLFLSLYFCLFFTVTKSLRISQVFLGKPTEL